MLTLENIQDLGSPSLLAVATSSMKYVGRTELLYLSRLFDTHPAVMQRFYLDASRIVKLPLMAISGARLGAYERSSNGATPLTKLR